MYACASLFNLQKVKTNLGKVHANKINFPNHFQPVYKN